MERSVIVKLNPVSERLQIEGNIDVRAGSVKFSCTGSMLRYTTMLSVRHGLGVFGSAPFPGGAQQSRSWSRCSSRMQFKAFRPCGPDIVSTVAPWSISSFARMSWFSRS
jgi:hypothetical protein